MEERSQAAASGVHELQDGRVGHAAALAHGLQAVAATRRLELVDEGREQAGSARAERVAEGDGAAARVEPGGIRAGLGERAVGVMRRVVRSVLRCVR